MRLIVVFLAFVSPAAFAGNFATCLLDDLPGVQGDAAAIAINKVCIAKYPGGLVSVSQGSGRGLFGYNSGAECAAKLAAKTPSRPAGTLIFYACNKLYNEPNPFDSFDAKLPQPPWKAYEREHPESAQAPKPDPVPAAADQPANKGPSETGNSHAAYKYLSEQQSPKCVIKPVMSDEEMARCKKR